MDAGATHGHIRRDDLQLDVPYRAPAAGLESKVAEAFARAFNVDRVGSDDDFYALGGDSLIGETLSMEILQMTGKTFQISWFFEHGTPAKVATKLGARTYEASGGRLPIFLVHGKAGFVVPKPKFYAGLAPGQTIEIFEVPGLRGFGETYEALEDIARAYVDELEQKYPAGPVLLGSFCTGALIAVEMAAQLQERGRQVHHMVLMDPGAPRTLFDRHRTELQAAGREVPPDFFKDAPSRSPVGGALLRLWSLVTVGRWTDGSTAQDFEDSRLRHAMGTLFTLQGRLESVFGRRNRHGRKKARNPAKQGLAIEPRTRLRAAYRHYWPRPYLGSVDIVASEGRRKFLMDDNSLWARIAPNRRVQVVAATHHEVINNADGTGTAKMLQKLFDESLGQATPAETAREPA